MYDDYQFVTQKELEELGLDQLIGSNLLKAYMHGYFIDVRLYNKAKAVVEPFAFERYRKEKIRKEIESERKSRLQINSNLPKYNQDLALKIMEDQAQKSKQKKTQLPNLLQDERFKVMFHNADFEINKNAEEYKMLAPVLNRLEKSKLKELKRRIEVAPVVQLQADEAQTRADSDNDEDLFGFDKTNENHSSAESSSSEEEENTKEFVKEMKKAYKDIKREREAASQLEVDEIVEAATAAAEINHKTAKLTSNKNINFVTLDGNIERDAALQQQQMQQLSLEGRIRIEQKLQADVKTIGQQQSGNRQMTFDMRKPPTREAKKREYEQQKHREERKKLVRSIKGAVKLKKVNYK